MKSEAELKAVTQFVAEYATRLMGSGVHTSRVVRNTKRLGEALGVRVMVSAFQKVVTFSVYDERADGFTARWRTFRRCRSASS